MSDSILQVEKIKPKDGSGTGAITIANSNSNVTIPSLAGGTIGSGVTIGTQDYFHAKLSSVQTISRQTWTEIAFNAVNDPNTWFNNTTKKFTPTKAGKYYIFMQAPWYATDGLSKGESQVIFLNKNSTTIDGTESALVTKLQIDVRSNAMYAAAIGLTAFVDMNGSSDYLYSGTYFNTGSGSNQSVKLEVTTHFSGFRIGP